VKHEGDLSDGGLIYSRFNTGDMRELAASLLKLCDAVPKTGRLNYKLMPQEVKDAIRDFLEKVLDKNADCDREFKKYVHAAVELCKYYTDKPETHEKAGKTAYDDMMNRLGNAVLRTVKKIKQQARDNIWETNHEAWRREMIESCITELFGILARAARAQGHKLAHAYRTDELSKQAKKELAMKLENSSNYDWEM
jgi:hypothetical protein